MPPKNFLETKKQGTCSSSNVRGETAATWETAPLLKCKLGFLCPAQVWWCLRAPRGSARLSHPSPLAVFLSLRLLDQTWAGLRFCVRGHDPGVTAAPHRRPSL